MLWALLTVVSNEVQPAPPAPPTREEVALKQEVHSGSCVLFTSGVCVCSNYEPTIDQLSCGSWERAGSYVCSYNIVWVDSMGLDPKYVEQRMDIFRSAADGWARSQYQEPKLLYD